MKKTILILLIGVTVAIGTAQAGNMTFYVSTAGNDSWTGKLAEPDKTKTDGPFATVKKARNAIRELKEAEGSKGGEGLKGPVTVQIRGGVYYLEDALVFSPKDSGSKDFPITYQAYKNEKPILSGGRLIKGWKKNTGGLSTVDSGLWTTEIPETMTENWYFNQLFVNGERRTRARTPNKGGYLRIAGPLSKGNAGKGFRYKEGDIREWNDPGDAIIVLYHSWESSIHFITSLDTANRVVKISPAPPWPAGENDKRQRYHVENLFEALDEPGEWFLNRTTGILYYYPMPGEDMAKAEVIAPFLKKTVMNLKGRPDQGQLIEYINFKGISFRHADANISKRILNSGQAACYQEAAVIAKGARNCRFEDCEIAHVGEYGIWLRQGCQDNTITRCVVRDMGAGGIRIGEGASPPDEASAVLRNVIDNNFVYDGSHIFHGGVGIFIARSSLNRITHNEICNLDYTGISVGWDWSNAPSSARDNIIEYNHIHHIMSGVMSDGGGIYTLGVSPGTRLRYNLIHDSYRYPGDSGYGGWGIYFDAGSSEILAENNVVYNTTDGGFFNHCFSFPSRNMVQNNIFAFSKNDQVIRLGDSDTPPFTIDFERNIVYCDNGKMLCTGNWETKKHYIIDNNCYWSTSAGEPSFAGMNFGKWQSGGRDKNSIIADPLFFGAADHDFRLKPNSPAVKTGFTPIDISRAGLYGEPEWVGLPKKIAARAVETAQLLPPEPINDDFEIIPEDDYPPGITISGENEAKGAKIQVTKEAAASGKHSLKFTDASGLDFAFNPHMFYTVRFSGGKMRFSFDLMNSAEKPAEIFVELRDWREFPYGVGPSVWFYKDGSFTANGKPMGEVPLGKWFRVEAVFELGENSAKSYVLKLTVQGEKTRVFEGLPLDEKFNVLTWAGFVSNSTGKTVFYADNIELGPAK